MSKRVNQSKFVCQKFGFLNLSSGPPLEILPSAEGCSEETKPLQPLESRASDRACAEENTPIKKVVEKRTILLNGRLRKVTPRARWARDTSSASSKTRGKRIKKSLRWAPSFSPASPGSGERRVFTPPAMSPGLVELVNILAVIRRRASRLVRRRAAFKGPFNQERIKIAPRKKRNPHLPRNPRTTGAPPKASAPERKSKTPSNPHGPKNVIKTLMRTIKRIFISGVSRWRIDAPCL